jgi:hypothetical protein
MHVGIRGERREWRLRVAILRFACLFDTRRVHVCMHSEMSLLKQVRVTTSCIESRRNVIKTHVFLSCVMYIYVCVCICVRIQNILTHTTIDSGIHGLSMRVHTLILAVCLVICMRTCLTRLGSVPNVPYTKEHRHVAIPIYTCTFTDM